MRYTGDSFAVTNRYIPAEIPYETGFNPDLPFYEYILYKEETK